MNKTISALSAMGIPGGVGFLAYTVILAVAAMHLPPAALDSYSKQFILALGAIAIWRYSWGLVHFCRSIIYRRLVFPHLRAEVTAGGAALMPPHIYLLVTSFRIQADATVAVYKSVIREAINSEIPATIVCSIVELGDEFLIKELFRQAAPPERVTLVFVRIAGTGKRDALAQGFRAISRHMPQLGAVVAVVDGDSIMSEGLIAKCAPFFALMPYMGALTTDEDCDVEGSQVMTDWHRLRFAQRNVQMGSMALSGKVMTLTGRMSMFRADIIANPSFIDHVENDSVEHWRLGRFKFLTGDDKSSWSWVLERGYDMMYIPDVLVRTVEHPPSPSFFKASTILMRRWFGNMLRINGKVLKFGPAQAGLFTWWCILDQRVAMWTSLTGPVFCLFLVLKDSWSFLTIYAVWVGFTRWVMALMLLESRSVLSWRYPFLIYYNQVWGSLVKIYVLFRLDRQSWTRQNTTLHRQLTPWQAFIVRWSSFMVHWIAMAGFVAFIGVLTGVLTFS